MERDAFLQAIARSPDDKTLLSDFGEWLIAQGEPLGDYIKILLEKEKTLGDSSQLRELEQRRHKLLDEHGQSWKGDIERLGVCRFSFGLPRCIEVPLSEFPQNAIEALRIAPTIAELRLTETPDVEALTSLAMSPHVGVLRALILNRLELDDEHLLALASSPFLDRLTRLEINDNQIGDAGFGALANAGSFGNLSEVHANGNGCTGAGFYAIVSSKYLRSLRSLWLGENAIADADFDVLGPAQRGSIVDLAIEGNDIGPRGAEWLAKWEGLSSIEQLSIHDTSLGDLGLATLAASPQLGSVRTIRAWNVGASGRAISALASSQSLARLSEVYLGERDLELTRASLSSIAASQTLKCLRVLSLSFAKADEDGVVALAGSALLSKIVWLSLSCNDSGPGDSAADAIATSPFATNIEKLNLSGWSITDEGLRAIAKSPYLRKLTELDLGWVHGVTAAGYNAVVNSEQLPKLRSILNDQVRTDDSMEAALQVLEDRNRSNHERG